MKVTWLPDSKISHLEMEMAEILEQIESQYVVLGHFKVDDHATDFAVPDLMLAIEVEERDSDGLLANAKRHIRDMQLWSKGWTVVSFSRSDVFNQAKRTRYVVEAALRERQETLKPQVENRITDAWDVI